MKLVKNLALIISAVFIARVLVTALGLLLSVTPIFFELSASEAALRITYEILIVYFLIVAVLLLITSISLFNQATKRNSFQLNLALTAIALSICGAHLAVAIVGNPESLLTQFAMSFIWVPVLVGFATLTSFSIAKSAGGQVLH